MADDAMILQRSRTAGAALKSASAIAFAPAGVLLVGDGLAGRLYAFETGESLRQMYARVTAKLAALAAVHAGQTVVVVVHGGVLDIVNRFVRGNPLEAPRDFLIPNAGLNWLSLRDGIWRIATWGDTAHLELAALDELPDPGMC